MTDPMAGSTTHPKVFISYSWTTPKHEQWVIDLAQRLSSDGITVALDKWDLKEGQDKHVFMEQMVRDKNITKVLVVCDSVYQSKADDRRGGVGTETQLISKEVYENTGQEKFIPIVCEYTKEGKPCLPNYMAGRIYIDLSSDETFESNYEKLVRNLYDKPILRRPPLGATPPYIQDEEQIPLRTSYQLRTMRDALVNDRKSASGLISDFLETFVTSLEDFRIENGANAPDFDERVVNMIEKMIPLRNNFMDFAFSAFRYRDSNDLDELHRFWESLIPFTDRPEHAQSWNTLDFDNYKFFNYELMLSFVAILLKLGKFKDAAFFLHSQYFFRTPTNPGSYTGIQVFNHYAESLERIRNERLSLRRASVTADLIKARATHPQIKFADLMQADLLLYYIVDLQGNNYGWFPRTSAYNAYHSSFELFRRMDSKRYFEKIKCLFGVESVEQLKTLAKQYAEDKKQSRNLYSISFNFRIAPIERMIDLEKLGSLP